MYHGRGKSLSEILLLSRPLAGLMANISAIKKQAVRCISSSYLSRNWEWVRKMKIIPTFLTHPEFIKEQLIITQYLINS